MRRGIRLVVFSLLQHTHQLKHVSIFLPSYLIPLSNIKCREDFYEEGTGFTFQVLKSNSS